MSLARRLSEPNSGASFQVPALSPLGLPELRSRRNAERARRRAQRVHLLRLAAFVLCFGTGVLAGLLAARLVNLHRATAESPSATRTAADRPVVSVRTME